MIQDWSPLLGLVVGAALYWGMVAVTGAIHSAGDRERAKYADAPPPMPRCRDLKSHTYWQALGWACPVCAALRSKDELREEAERAGKHQDAFAEKVAEMVVLKLRQENKHDS